MALEYKTYEEAKERFRWRERWELFDGTKDRFNIAHECIDRHPRDDVAIRIRFEDGRSEVYTFGEFSEMSCRFANFFESRGIGQGDSVAIMLFPSFSLYVSMFGVFRRGAIAVLCFPLFGPDAIAFRLEKSRAKAIVTTRDMVEIVDPDLAERLNLKVIYADDLIERLKKESSDYAWNTSADTPCMIQFSSGTTGAPKSIMYRHGAISVAAVVMKLGNGLREDDTYFCPSSPGWGHGIWYGTIAPLIFGRAIGTYSGKFDPEKVLEAMEEWGVTNMAAISSHYRLIIGSGIADRFDIKLRRLVYTGEAMTRDMIEAVHETWGIYPYVQYGTTEAGPITLDYGGFENWVVKPGSLGKPMIGGVKVAVLGDDDRELPCGEVGQIALWRNNAWVKIGDSAYMDEDGYFWYVSRIDDVIISSGYTIGPVEVEGAILKHPAVEECAVVGSPDKDRGDVVKAFIKLKQGYSPSDELAEEIRLFVRSGLSKHEYPREIEFIEDLPKTPDGKIRRKVLKERERSKKLELQGA
ncbi:MAG: AMP-binding protein [Deltaproteobacteria bacterium]|nr:AMP-binding protein [Deltaproteobacteria bacterium]